MFYAKVKLSSLPEPAANPRDSPRFGYESGNRPKSPAQIFVRSLSPPPSLVRKSPVPPSEIVLGGPTTFNPFDTTALHIFIREAFSGAILLEEHQVGILRQHLFGYPVNDGTSLLPDLTPSSHIRHRNRLHSNSFSSNFHILISEI